MTIFAVFFSVSPQPCKCQERYGEFQYITYPTMENDIPCLAEIIFYDLPILY